MISRTKEGLAQHLAQHLQPTYLSIEDQSHQHAGHNPAAKEGGTHFAITIISQAFQGLSTVQRHKHIYKLLEDQLANGLHALSLKTKTPEEVKDQG